MTSLLKSVSSAEWRPFSKLVLGIQVNGVFKVCVAFTSE